MTTYAAALRAFVRSFVRSFVAAKTSKAKHIPTIGTSTKYSARVRTNVRTVLNGSPEGFRACFSFVPSRTNNTKTTL